MLEFCLDTGDFEMVKIASSIYPVNCFSMNPSIAVNCLKGTGKSFVQNALDIRGVIGEETPFFLFLSSLRPWETPQRSSWRTPRQWSRLFRATPL